MSHRWQTSTLALALVALGGCASQQTAQTPVPATPAPSAPNQQSPAATAPKNATEAGRSAKSQDGSFEGEVVGNPAPGSKFSKVKIGMSFREVTRLIGAPDDMQRYETGKRWIPFYFGNDAQRVETLYRKEGCLTFTGGNVFGGGGEQLIRIQVDPKDTCMG